MPVTEDVMEREKDKEEGAIGQVSYTSKGL